MHALALSDFHRFSADEHQLLISSMARVTVLMRSSDR
jgi:hypothetical protein